jgi:hypothetical protein
MNKTLASATLLVTAIAIIPVALARDDDERESHGRNAITLAVYGDAPYGCKAFATGAPDECPLGSIYKPDSATGPNPGDPRQIEATPAFIAAVNRDNKVDQVLFVGDIHSGSGFCTQAYNQTVFDLWTQFQKPLVYTPGDNEWTDCQKPKEGGGAKIVDPADPLNPLKWTYVTYAAGHPVANLALVRSMFFPEAGKTLGGHKKYVTSQAQAFDPNYPTDAEYVENVMWEESGVMFVTLNIPGGSNNDDDLWTPAAYGAFVAPLKSAPQLQEINQRTAADLRWLDAAFVLAKAHGDVAVQITEQADMWDLDGTPLAAGHIANYEPFVAKIHQLTKDFGKPVLLINGDSHHYRSDNPLKSASLCAYETGVAANTGACPDDAYANRTHPAGQEQLTNFHRLVVHGSTFPLEYTRLTVNPKVNVTTPSTTAFGPFSWERVIP